MALSDDSKPPHTASNHCRRFVFCPFEDRLTRRGGLHVILSSSSHCVEIGSLIQGYNGSDSNMQTRKDRRSRKGMEFEEKGSGFLLILLMVILFAASLQKLCMTAVTFYPPSAAIGLVFRDLVHSNANYRQVDTIMMPKRPRFDNPENNKTTG